jgi:hypothetical protein
LNNNIVERSESDVIRAVLALFPDALLSDDDGQLVIYTNCMWTGKNGQAIIGQMTIEGDTPEWEDS